MPPEELIEYLICEKFGWTITELYEQPDNKVQKFFQIMQMQRQAESKKE